MHERGLVLSTLHPATTVFYRRLGWEIGGEFGVRTVPGAALAALPRGEPECVRPGSGADHEIVRECYERISRTIDGTLVRTDPMWGAWARWFELPHHYLYVFEDGDRVQGYVRYAYRRTASEWGFAITVHELFAATAEAGLTLWRHVGSHAAQVDEITVLGGRPDALVLLLPEQVVRLVDANHWMTRIIDVRGAIAARGFPPGVSARVELEIGDRLAPWNDDRFVLQVEDGRGTLERGGRGGAHLTVNGLASLYTGWASPGALASAGLLVGADERDLQALTAAFAGPPPALFDDF
jgi:predicted acetyltransferase